MANAYPGSAIPGSTYPGEIDNATGSDSVKLTSSGTLTATPSTARTADSVKLTSNGVLLGSGLSIPITIATLAGYPDPTNSPPRILVQGNLITGVAATVVRITPDGHATQVRQPSTINGGIWIGYDYEAPFNTPVYYRLTSGDLIVESPLVVLPVGRPWFEHPGVPDLSCPINVKSMGDETDDATIGVFPILDNEYPLVRTDGRRKAGTFEMLIKTETREERDNLDQLFQDCSTLLLQVVYPDQTTESDYLWVSVGAVTKARKSQAYGDTSRVWTLPITVVGRPSGLLQSQRTYADLLAEGATYADIDDLYNTYRGVLLGIAGD